MPKIIYHSCEGGYLTEIQFEGKQSRLFTTMQEALAYLSMFCPPSTCPQEIIAETCSKASVIESLTRERETEND